jgi:hypothetical protein
MEHERPGPSALAAAGLFHAVKNNKPRAVRKERKRGFGFRVGVAVSVAASAGAPPLAVFLRDQKLDDDGRGENNHHEGEHPGETDRHIVEIVARLFIDMLTRILHVLHQSVLLSGRRLTAARALT